MNINVKHDLRILLGKTLARILRPYDLDYELVGVSVIKVVNSLSEEHLAEISDALNEYGIELIDGHTNRLVSNIKTAIATYITNNERTENLSCYLSEKLGYSYAHLSSVFTSNTLSTIENFVILKRIDIAKQLLMTDQYTLTEVAYALGFSNVSHLSGQFKKVTGLTPSRFIKIVEKRVALNTADR